MLKNNMDFNLVELDLKKFKTTTIGQKKAGQWVTKHYLLTAMNWTKIHILMLGRLDDSMHESGLSCV